MKTTKQVAENAQQHSHHSFLFFRHLSFCMLCKSFQPNTVLSIPFLSSSIAFQLRGTSLLLASINSYFACPNAAYLFPSIKSTLHHYLLKLRKTYLLLSMAKSAITSFFLVSAMLILSPSTTAFEGKVGGRMEVRDVKNNKEVQDLGRFSIHEFNKLLLRHHRGGNGGEELLFSKVVAAERQVVSGVKYYLKIEATNQIGEKRYFHSVVVVKPWLKSKELIKFEPAAAIELRRFKK